MPGENLIDLELRVAPTQVDGIFTSSGGGKVAKLQILVAGKILAPVTIRAGFCFPLLPVAQISTGGK